MLGCQSGFQARVKAIFPDILQVHREALACKTLPAMLKEVLQEVVKKVNFIKASALNTRLFQDLCSEMDSKHQNLLCYTEVRWLSKGNVLKRCLKLKEEMKEFFAEK